jgi:uncharacterized membrane protein
MHNTRQNEGSITEFLTDFSPNVGGAERAVSAAAGGALVAFGLKQGGAMGTLATVLGGGLLFRGATGHCHAYDAMGVNTAGQGEGSKRSLYGHSLFSGRIHVAKAVTINKSPAELYQFWRNFENLPLFMKHLESVTRLDGNRSHWKAKAPLGTSVEWDAEMTSDVANERIGWQSVDGSDIANSGVVEFRPTVNRGTEVKVTMIYEAPGGKLGEWVAWLFGEEPSFQVKEDLRRFKQLMETGIIITTDGQPSGAEPMPAKTMTARA